jgi:anthranilate synthase component 1
MKVVTDRIRRQVDVCALFSRLTDGGTVPGSMLLESGDLAPTYAERSIAVIRPSICLSGKDERFEIHALDRRGEALLPLIGSRLPSAAEIATRDDDHIAGTLRTDLSSVSFCQRLENTSHADLLRAALLDHEGPHDDLSVPFGLYGCFAYDFVRQFEDIPRCRTDPLDDPDYVFYLSTRLVVSNHVRNETAFVSCIPRDSDALFIDEAHRDIAEMKAAADGGAACVHDPVQVGDFTSDTSEGEFCTTVAALQEAIAEGRAFQVVCGRMLEARFAGNVLDVYCSLKRCNPSPYMFYMRDARGTLLGASPELAVRVSTSHSGRTVELKPIAGTKPRGVTREGIDAHLDERFEVALRIDAKELAEHTMLVDLARNDIAAIACPGTTLVRESLVTEKYSHVQHLVSKVEGRLRDDLDALDAYLATMNMGTLTGAPKPEAMRLVSEFEKSARGFFGGGVGFLTSRGEMETAIIIRAMRIIDGRVYIRAGAGIVADSVPRHEWVETAAKARACIVALEEAADGH